MFVEENAFMENSHYLCLEGEKLWAQAMLINVNQSWTLHFAKYQVVASLPPKILLKFLLMAWESGWHWVLSPVRCTNTISDTNDTSTSTSNTASMKVLSPARCSMKCIWRKIATGELRRCAESMGETLMDFIA